MRDSIATCLGESDLVFFHEKEKLSFEEAKKGFPQISKGWFELSKLQPPVRLEFIRDYWINAVPYFPHVYAAFDRFFSQVEEIGIVGSKRGVYMTYTLKTTFFIGGIPLSDEGIETLKGQFDFPFPKDYLHFFRIHNGFAKGKDTGILPAEALPDACKNVRSREGIIRCGQEVVDLQELFPFYRSFGLDVYQCFYQNWYVDGQVGNVLCSLAEGKISDFRTREKGEEYLAFTSFLDWLIFYLEGL